MSHLNTIFRFFMKYSLPECEQSLPVSLKTLGWDNEFAFAFSKYPGQYIPGRSSLFHAGKTGYQNFVCDVCPPQGLYEGRRGKEVLLFVITKTAAGASV